MIVFKLNSSFKPDTTIKNFESLVWTERYREAGDFQLVVNNEISILTLLPKGCLISHTDTSEVMIVENHEIERDKSKVLKITVSGRSFETFAENRVTDWSIYPIYEMDGVTKKDDQLRVGAAEDVAMEVLKYTLVHGFASTNDEIVNLLIRKEIRILDTSMDHPIKRGQVYSQVLDLLGLSDSGIKTIRPNDTQTTIDLVIHDGLDKTNSVVFYAQYEDLDDAKYFWSNKDYKNYVRIATHINARLYKDRAIPIEQELKGLDRRIIYVEADDIVEDYGAGTSTDPISARAQTELNQNQETSLMTAKISKTAKPKFKFHYDVGDIVTVFGEFSTSQVMRVTEHILTVDKDGMQGYPSLSIV